MKKQIFGILLALCMAAAMVSLQAVAASAAEEECTCLVKCTADNMNADCPVCSKAGATVGNCKGRFPFSGEVTVDLQLQNIMNLDQTNQAIYYFPLSDDITIASALTEITVPQGADVVLDLNGHTISRKGDGKIFVVYGKLTIIDSVGTGKLTNATDGALDIRGGGYVLMQGGSIEGNHNATQTVYAVYVNDSTFEMTGGTIKNNRAFGIKNIYAYNSTVIIDGTAQVLCCEEDGCEHNVRKYTDSIVLNARTKLYLDGGNIKGNIFIKEISVTVDSRHAGAGTVVNGYLNVFSGIIKAGTYTGLVKFDDAFIYGGTFLGTVELSKYTRIYNSAKVPVKFVTDAGKVIATVKVLRGQGIAAEDIPTVSDPTTYGYSYFAGWSIGSDQYYAGGGQFVDNVNYVTAKFGNPIKYTLSIDLEGGTASNPTTYTADDTFTLENPTKEGYIFTGWSGTDLVGENNMTVTIPKGSTGHRGYKAHYISTSISVSAEEEMRNGIALGVTKITLLDDITLSSTLDLSDKAVTLDLNGHTLTGNIKLADTSAAPQSVLTLQDSSTAANGVLDGKIELTRGSNGTASRLYANGGTVTGMVSLNSYVAGIYCTSHTPTAFWGYVGSYGEIHGGIFYGSVKESNIKEKTVTFMSEGSRYALEVVDGDGITIEPVIPPLKPGYGKLKGWYNGETKYTFGSALSENMTLTAEFTLLLHYKITYILNGGSVSPLNPTEYNVITDDITLINPTRDGYMFTGWGGTDLKDTNNMAVTIPKGSTGDRTYTAYYLESFVGEPTSPNYFYTVVYDTRGGSPVEPKKVGLGDTSKVEVLDGVSTTRAGYRFSGWYCGSRRIALQDTTVEDLKGYSDNGVITLTARWTEKKTVSFDTAAQDCTYDGTEKAYAITGTTLDGFNVTYRQDGNLVTNPTDAGLYDVIVTRAEDEFYKAVNETVKCGLVIGPKEVSVTIDAIPDEIYTGSEITPSVTVYDGETVIPANEYTVAYTDNRNVGRATVTLTDNTDGNYTAISGSASFEIKPKAVTATISAIPDEIYTGGEITPTVTAYDGETVIPAGEYTVEYADNINAGTATVTLTDNAGGNYTVGGSTSFEITPKNIEGAVLAPSETLIYNGTEQTQTVTVTLAGFDPVTFTVSGNKQTDVNTSGAYTLTVTANGNFTGTKTLDWNIAPATPVENPAKKTTARVAKNKTLADASVSNGEILALDGTTPLAGTFAWVDSTTVMRASGTAQMTFTPESTNYAPITIDVAVTAYSSGGGGGGVAAPASYTVRFDSNGGSGIASQTVAEGGKVTSPANPTKDGYTFDGWYTDKELTEKYDFAAAVTKDFTLYAKWVKEEWKKPFTDIREDDWFYADIAYVYESGLMTGTSTTEFSPDATTTRGMVVTILYRLDGSPAVGSSCPFNDIASDAYYKDAAAWAVANGIAGGYGNALFGPNDSITREQLATLLYRYAKYKGLDVSVDDETNILGYNDAQSISEYAFPAMQWLCGKGILQGINGSLMPAESATRAQIAALLHRFCETVMKG